MRYVIYGAGAVGGVIGAHLHRVGLSTTLIARGAHLEAIRRDGLVLDAVGGPYKVTVPASDTAADVEWTDDTVVLLCVKSHQTAAALDDLIRHAPATTAIVATQNGVANEAMILRRFARALSICVILPALHLEPGVVVQKCTPTPGILDVGCFPGGVDRTVESISADLRSAGFDSEPRPDIMAWKHRKLLFNAVSDVSMLFAPGAATAELARRVGLEGEAVLAAARIPTVTAEEDAARRGDVLRTRADVAGFHGNSLWQSLARGLGSEIDYRVGELVLLARLHGVDAPASIAVQATAVELVRTGQRAGSADAGPVLTALPGPGAPALRRTP